MLTANAVRRLAGRQVIFDGVPIAVEPGRTRTTES